MKHYAHLSYKTKQIHHYLFVVKMERYSEVYKLYKFCFVLFYNSIAQIFL
jgi:hypothetical protein